MTGIEQFLRKKINIMKVLFEMLNLVEQPNDADGQVDPIFAKLVSDSSFFIQIFVDLAIYLSQQNAQDVPFAILEEFMDNCLQLLEIYLFKTNNYDIMQKAIDYIMCQI